MSTGLETLKFVQPGYELVSKEIEVSIFDNQNTILYKLVKRLSYPKEYILVSGDNSDNYRYTSAHVYMLKKFYDGNNYDLLDVYDEMVIIFKDIWWEQIAMIYIEIMTRFEVEKVDILDEDGNNVNTSEDHFEIINKMYEDVRFRNKRDIEPLRTVAHMEEYYNNWVEMRNNMLISQMKVYEKIINVQSRIEDFEEIDYENPVITEIYYVFKPKLADVIQYDDEPTTYHDPVPEEAIEIFNMAKVSPIIPFVQYGSADSENYYKIFNDPDENKIDTPSIYLNENDQTRKSDIITVFIWIGEKSKTRTTKNYSVKNAMIKCIYNIEKGEFSFSVPERGGTLEHLKDLLEKAFPLLFFGKGDQTQVGGHFYVNDITINDSSFIWLLHNDDILKTYLYIDEKKSAWADRSRYSVGYKNFMGEEEDGTSLSTVSISFGDITKNVEGTGELPETLDPSAKSLSHMKGKLKINVKKAKSKEVVIEFLRVFSRLLGRYKNIREKIEDLLYKIIPEGLEHDTKKKVKSETKRFRKKEKKKEKKSVKVKDAEEKITQTMIGNLKERAPDVFKTRWARDCQLSQGKQPIVIKNDEVAEWREFLVHSSSKNTYETRQVMPFPPIPPSEDGEHENVLTIDPNDERVKYWVVCPNPQNSYPSLKAPRDDKDAEYPYLPCCGKTNQLAKNNSPYYDFYSEKKIKVGNAKYSLTTSKVLKFPKRLGSIGNVLNLLLQFYTDVENVSQVFKRYGTPMGTNSLIHSILYATSDVGYGNLRDDETKDKYASSVRRYIADSIDPNLLKQELYDMTDEEIIAEIRDETVNFTSSKFYRALEEVFGINIYVFDPKKSSSSDEEENMSVEIPRSKVFHVRPYRLERPTVLIFKQTISKKNEEENFHYELIVAKHTTPGSDEEFREIKRKKRKVVNPSKESFTFIFGEQMNGLIYKILMTSAQSYVWSFPENKAVENKKVITRVNPFSKLDWENIFKNYPIVSQRLDSYGKMRVIGVQISKSFIMTVSIPPSQPLNLPYLEEVTTVNEKDAVEIFGPPSGVSSTGLWYPILDYVYGVFIPTKIPKDGKINVKPRPIKSKKIEINKKNRPNPRVSPRPIARVSPRPIKIEKKKSNIDPIIKVPFQNEKFLLDYVNGEERVITEGLPDDPISSSDKVKEYPIQTMRTAKRNIYYLIQMIRWLWRLDKSRTGQQGKNMGSFTKWWDKWVVSDRNVSTKVSDDCSIGIKFPVVDNTADGIYELELFWPKFFFGDKIHLYPSIYLKLLAFFKNEDRITRGVKGSAETFVKTPEKFIKGVYAWRTDFTKNMSEYEKKTSIVFTSYTHLKAWTVQYEQKKMTSGSQINIAKSATSSSKLDSSPYIYYDTNDERAYIIQGVKNGNLERVFQLCKNWENDSTNTGFLTPKDEDEDVPAHVLYSISPNDKLVQIMDNTDGDLNYFHIIKYAEIGRYSAMLPLT
jgi:hypothetical protein